MKNFISGIKKRISNRKGFSLTELLAATLIMALSTGIVAGIMNLAASSFFRTTQIAEAQTLCSTIATYVESELTYAKVNEAGTGFYSDVHNFGPDACFVASSQSNKIVFNGSKVYGRIGETSPMYGDQFYDIAGAKAYDIGAGNTNDLTCGMQLGLSGNTVTCTIEIVDANNTSNVLASRVIVITVRK